MRVPYRRFLPILVAGLLNGFAADALAERSGRATFLRFNGGATLTVQGTAKQYSGGLTWNPRLFSLGFLDLDLLADVVIARDTSYYLFAIAGGGAALRINLGSTLSLSGGILYQFWTSPQEKVWAPYGALTLFWNRNSFFQGLTLAYTYSVPTWGIAHMGRAYFTFAF